MRYLIRLNDHGKEIILAEMYDERWVDVFVELVTCSACVDRYRTKTMKTVDPYNLSCMVDIVIL